MMELLDIISEWGAAIFGALAAWLVSRFESWKRWGI